MQWIAKWLLGTALLVTVLAYWTGLHGPFLLDDTNNLAPIVGWLNGDSTWRHVLFSNGSGLLGRPLSMATLMLSAKIGGYTSFAFKFGNLIVHLLCGLLGWQVLRCLLANDRHLRVHADLIATLLVTLWLLHPLNVSTVLYSVQRMAQLSTLFTLAALWAYLSARDALARAQTRRALAGLFIVFPSLVILGLLCKENAAVAPALCLVLELAYFRAAPARKRILLMFYGIFLALPVLVITSAVLLHPAYLLAGYGGRDFTLSQRVLSEGRALTDYVGALLLPRGPTMGVFTDDFVISTGLMSPPATLYAMLTLAAITATAIALRKRAPSVFAGWCFFLVAHAMESSILALELYFEHRNYLPAFGLLLATAGAFELVTRKLQTSTLTQHRLGLLAACGYVLVLTFATHARAKVWADEGTLLAQEVRYHPGSLRADLAMTWYGIHHGELSLADAALDRLLRSPNPRTRELGHLNRVLANCISQGIAISGDLRKAEALARPVVTLEEMYAFENLAEVDAMRECKHAGPIELADTITIMLAAAHAQPDGQLPKWHLRLASAKLYARAGDWARALPQAELAWQPSADAPVGGFLIRTYLHNGMRADAERTYAEVVNRADPNSNNDRLGLAELRKFLDQDSAEAQFKPKASTR